MSQGSHGPQSGYSYVESIAGVERKPLVIRCDNGPEFISPEFVRWATEHGIRIEYIQLGKPQQNTYIERYNRTIRYIAEF